LTQVPTYCQLRGVVAIRKLNQGGRVFYEVCWFVKGERQRKYFKSHSGAVAKWRAVRKAKGSGLAEFDALPDDDKVRLFQAWQRADEGGYDLLGACMEYEKETEPEKPIQFSEAQKLFLAAKTAKGLRPESLKSYRSTYNQFGARFDNDNLDGITAEQVATWLDGQHYSGVRFNRALADLGTLRNWAESKGYSVGRHDPFAGNERRLLDQADVSILTVEQAADYLAKAVEVPECGPVTVLVMKGGLRVSEALQTRPQDIDLDDSIVTVRGQASKLRARRICSLQPSAIYWLALALEKGGLLPLSQSVYDKARRANLPAIPANSLRHSFCSYHLAHFKNIGLTAEEAGNSPEMIAKHYKELVRPKAAAKFWQVGQPMSQGD
jgi:integrase